MVSLTLTAVSIFGSRVVVPGTGILLSNGMLWCDPEPGKPNSVAPGKRALVNMVSALAFKRGASFISLGAPGGRKIISAIPQVLSQRMAVSMALPCRISVYQDGRRTKIATMLPTAMLAAFPGAEGLKPVAEEVERQIRKMIDEAK